MEQPFKISTTFQLPMKTGYYVTVKITLSSIDVMSIDEAEAQFQNVAMIAESNPLLTEFLECKQLVDHLKKIF